MHDSQLPDTLMSIIEATFEEKALVLNSIDINDRFQLALPLIKRQVNEMKAAAKLNESNKRVKTEESIIVPLKSLGRATQSRRESAADDQDDEIKVLEKHIT